MEADRTSGLVGKGVLITRPKQQAVEFAKRVLTLGGIPYVFPTLEISDTPVDALNRQLSEIRADQILIFVSVNAVKGVFQNIEPGLRRQLATVQIAAVGEQTQAALAAENMQVAITPSADQQTTEGLLCHPSLQTLDGQYVTIVRAQGGRETLRKGLQARGARVNYVQAYQRLIPSKYNAVPIIAALQSGEIQFVLLTSYHAFLNLLQMLGKQAERLLLNSQLIVPSERVATKISAAFPLKIIVAAGASDEAMLAVLA